jgi:hypothetical protein
MKTIKSYIAAGATTVMLLTSISCSKTFYTNANVNPNAPNNVPSNTLLTGVEVSLAYTQGGAIAQFTSLFTQQTFGNQRQAQAYYSYILTPADPEYQWDQMYTDVMENDYTLLNQAQAAGQNEYYGIANIIMAYSLQTMVDEFGNIPYSTGLQGASNIQPTYDNQTTLYNTIITLLNTGITALSNSNAGPSRPTTDDVIYAGSETDWIQFAHAIKARIYIHQCKHGNVAFEDSAIANVQAAGLGAASSSYVNAVVAFGASSTNNAPWYQFNNQRAGYIYAVPSSLIDSMQAMNDPRDSIFVDFATSSMGNYYGGATSPVEFITTEELYLIAAEAYTRLGNAPAAQLAYTASINASMTKLGVPAAEAVTYLASPAATLSANPGSPLHQIGVQQWIVEYLNPEAWTSWRRNDAPYLTPIAGTNGVVRRMIYPNSEVTLNPNTPAGVTLWAPTLFWDN